MSFKDTTGVKGPWAPFSLESTQLILPPNFRLYPNFRSPRCPQRGHEESSFQCKHFLSTEKLYYSVKEGLVGMKYKTHGLSM